MNKNELRDAIASHADLTNAQADKALEAVITSITQAVARGDKVTVPGFGTFESRERAARTGRNPRPARHWRSPLARPRLQARRRVQERRQRLTSRPVTGHASRQPVAGPAAATGVCRHAKARLVSARAGRQT